MSNKFLIGIGLAFVVVFAGGIAAVVGISSVTDGVVITKDTAPSQPAPPPSRVADFSPAAFAPIAATVRPPPAPVPQASAVAPGVPVPVLDSDLANLAAAVKLGTSSTGDVTKDVWARELPIAQKLLGGMCDCDQHNWLLHFVQAAQEAVSGSSHFPESIQLLAQLRRSNQDLTSNQVSR